MGHPIPCFYAHVSDLAEQADGVRHVGTGMKQHGSATVKELRTTREEWFFWFGNNKVGGLCGWFANVPLCFSNLCVLFVLRLIRRSTTWTVGVNCSNTWSFQPQNLHIWAFQSTTFEPKGIQKSKTIVHRHIGCHILDLKMPIMVR